MASISSAPISTYLGWIEWVTIRNFNLEFKLSSCKKKDILLKLEILSKFLITFKWSIGRACNHSSKFCKIRLIDNLYFYLTLLHLCLRRGKRWALFRMVLRLYFFTGDYLSKLSLHSCDV